MTPVAPLLALAMVYPLRDLMRSGLNRRVATAGVAIVVGVCVAMFAFFYPLLSASPLTYDSWRTRIWFDGWI
jgi:dolichyl-phosphate-mannose--protein O-mannosyl transferase